MASSKDKKEPSAPGVSDKREFSQEVIAEFLTKGVNFIIRNWSTLVIITVIILLIFTISTIVFYYMDLDNQTCRSEYLSAFHRMMEMNEDQESMQEVVSDEARLSDLLTNIKGVVDVCTSLDVDCPERYSAHFMLGSLYFHSRNFDEATTQWGVVADKTDFYLAARAQFNVGLAYQELARENPEKYLLAINAYQELIDQFPNSPLVPDARYQLALCYEKQGNLEQALDILEILETQENMKDMVTVFKNRILIAQRKSGIYPENATDATSPTTIDENQEIQINQISQPDEEISSTNE